MTILKIPVYEHPEMDYPTFYASTDYNKPGFHVLKFPAGTYLRFGTPVSAVINSIEWPTAVALFPDLKEVTPSTQGISESTLLKALAIAQDPTLALNLLK
jgi:hypothetical protein